MTKPYLYSEVENARTNVWYFPGDNDAPLKDDDTTHNLLPANIAEVQSDSGVTVNGTEAVIIPFDDPPALGSTGTIADSAINRGVVGIEWTGTGTSQQINFSSTDYVFTHAENGQLFEGGAWVYLQASAAVDITLRILWRDGALSTVDTSDNTTTVQPNTWTYITVNSDLTGVQESSTENALLIIRASISGNTQSIGDKLYIGATALGPGVASGWVHSTTPRTDVLDLRFDAKILGDGVILSNRTGEAAASNGDGFHIEAANEGFHVRTGTRTDAGTLTTQTYTTATNIYEYDVWYTFRWKYVPSTGTHTFYILRNGGWSEIDSGSVATTTDNLSTCYGIETLTTGLTVGEAHLLLYNFGFGDGNDELGSQYEVVGDGVNSDTSADLLGSAIALKEDGTTANYNNSFFLSNSGWIINADAATLGALELPYRSELKYGTGDFTIVQTFAGIADTGFRPTYDDYNTNDGIKIRPDSGTFSALVGPVTLDFTANPLDGDFHSILLERESGVEVRGFIDDLNTADATIADGGADLNNVTNLSLGRTPAGTTSSYLSACIGLTITFNRLLEEWERDALEEWIDSGYAAFDEPSWLRTEAVLYLNPNDPVQIAEYTARDRLINLAVESPDTVYVRYDFASFDGISNPVMNSNKVGFSNLKKLETGGKFYAVDAAPAATVNFELDTIPQKGKLILDDRDGYKSIPLDELGTDWVNNDFTFTFWIYALEFGTGGIILGQGPLDGANSWDIRLDATGNMNLEIANTQILQVTAANVAEAQQKMTMVTVTRAGNDFEIFFDKTSKATATNAATVTLQNDLTYGGSASNNGPNCVLGPLHIWEKALPSTQISALFNSSTRPQGHVFSDNITFTDSFSTQSLNWGEI